MAWLEKGYRGYSEQYWQVREWQWQSKRKNKRYKRTIDIIKIPLTFHHFEYGHTSFCDYILFLYFTFNGKEYEIDRNNGIYLQIDDEDYYIWLPEEPKEELFKSRGLHDGK